MPSMVASTAVICGAAPGLSSRIQVARPATISPAGSRPRTPWAWTSSNAPPVAGEMRAWAAVCTMDLASGWFECCSASAAAWSRAAPSTPSAGASRATEKRPVVRVPVLSRTTVSMSAAASR